MNEPLAHIGVGDPPIHTEYRPGTTCEDCAQRLRDKYNELEKNFEENWSGTSFASVPGGASVARLGGMRGPGLTASQSQKKFDGDLDAYRSSKQGGLQPDSSTREGVEKVERRVESQDRVLDQHAKGNLQLGAQLQETIRQSFIDGS